MKEEWLMSGAVVPVNVETTAALVSEIKRLIDVVGGMALAQPDNTSKLYEKLRSIIDGGSESFTHKDAVQYLKDNLAPLKWTPEEDMAYRLGGLSQAEHPAQLARLGWQYVECPACGSEGARAFPKPEQEPVAWVCYSALYKHDIDFDEDVVNAVPVGSLLYTSPPQRQLESTTDMMMELADRLGELPDDIDPRAWEHLLVYAPKRQPMTDEDLDLMCEKALFCRISFQQFARSIEAAHNIGDKT